MTSVRAHTTTTGTTTHPQLGERMTNVEQAASGSEDHAEHRREVADLDLLYAFDVPTIAVPEDDRDSGGRLDGGEAGT